MDGELHTLKVQCIKNTKTLDWDNDKWTTMHKEWAKLTGGAEIVIDSSTFVTYTVEIGTLEEVNTLYEAVKSHNLKAKHVVCVYRLPG